MCKIKRKILPCALFLSVIIIFFIMEPSVANASVLDDIWDQIMEELGEALSERSQAIIDILKNHSDWLQYGSFMLVIMHEIGWIIIKGLFAITSFLEDLIPESLSLLDFLDNAGLNELTSAIINDLVVALMVLTFVYLGIKTVIAKSPPNFKSVGVNIFISAFLILGLPSLMDTMEDISTKFFDATQTGNNNGNVSSLSWGLIQDNTADLFYAVDQGFNVIHNDANNTKKNELTPDIFRNINLSELITPEAIDDVDSDSDELQALKYTLVNDGHGNFKLMSIDNGGVVSWFTDTFQSGYFRYSAKFFPIIIGLLALIVAYVFTLFVFTTTAIEIGFKRVVGLFVFATDLESGERTKMVMKDIMNAFLLIAFTGLSLKMFTLFLTFLATADLNLIMYIIAVVSATFILIKGSNTMMRYFGVDVGLKEGFGQLAGAFAVGRATAGGMKGLKNLGKGLGKDKSNSANDTKDQLAQQDGEMPSINDGQDGNSKRKGIGASLKNSVNTAGKKAGYLANRGVSGALEDTVQASKDKVSNGFNQKKKALSDGANGIKTGWKDGLNEGAEKAASNKERMQQKKQLPESLAGGNTSNQQSANGTDSGNKNGHSVSSSQQKKDLNSTGNTQSNEDILANMKLNDSINPKNVDSTGNLNLKPNVDGTSVNDNGTSEQRVLGNMEMKNDTISPKSEVAATVNNSQSGSVTQKVMQQVEKTSLNNPESAKQRVIQDVQHSPSSANDVKQRVVQEVDKANVATPQQVTQNVQQVLSGSNLPNETQTAVQKIMQDVQGSSAAPETVKAKVIQEVEKASLGNETIKQNVIQDVQKAFTATPEQIEQNIKQKVGTVENQASVDKNDNRYFGSLFGENIKNDVPKKKSRFDKYNKK